MKSWTCFLITVIPRESVYEPKQGEVEKKEVRGGGRWERRRREGEREKRRERKREMRKREREGGREREGERSEGGVRGV